MRRMSGFGVGSLAVAVLVGGLVPAAMAQVYPGGFGRYGWGGWGSGYVSDPNATYMRGLGYYLDEQGKYQIDEQKARSLQIDNIEKWNKALSDHQRAQRIEQSKKDAQAQVEDAVARNEYRVKSGEALNDRIDRIVEFPAEGTQAALAAVPLSPEALRAITFENQTEALTFCLDELTAEEAWPPLLKGQDFAGPRSELAEGVDEALKEDLAGPISGATKQKIEKALSDFRGALDKVEFFDRGKEPATQYLARLSAIVRMMEDPKGRAVAGRIESYKGGTLADLVTFMHAYNLRIGPAESDREVTIYQGLYQQLAQVPDSFDNSKLTDTGPLQEATRGVAAASEEVFKGLAWSDLDATGQPSGKRDR